MRKRLLSWKREDTEKLGNTEKSMDSYSSGHKGALCATTAWLLCRVVEAEVGLELLRRVRA